MLTKNRIYLLTGMCISLLFIASNICPVISFVDYLMIIMGLVLSYLIAKERGVIFLSIIFIAFIWERIGPFAIWNATFLYTTIFLATLFIKDQKASSIKALHWIELPLFIIIISMGLSMYNIRYIGLGRTEVFSYLIGLMVMCAVYKLSKNNDGEKKTVIFSLIFMAVIASILGIWQYISGTTIWNGGGIDRIHSTFLHPSVLSGCLALIVPFIFAMIIYKRNIWHKTILFLVLLVVLSALLLTYMRGAWISVAVAGLTMLFIKRGLLKGLAVIFLTLAALFLLFINLPKEFKAPIEKKLLIKKWDIYTFTTGRNIYWIKGFKACLQRPVRGFGPTKHVEIFKNFANAHNFYLAYWMDWGIFSLISILFIIFKILKDSLSIARGPDRFKGAVSLGVFGSMTVFLVNGIAEYFFIHLKYIVTFWIIVGLFLSLGPIREKTGEKVIS